MGRNAANFLDDLGYPWQEQRVVIWGWGFAASALHFASLCFMFPYGFAIPRPLAIQGNASERPSFLSPSQPNGTLNGISGRATGNVANCATKYTASTDSQPGNPGEEHFGDKAFSVSVQRFPGKRTNLQQVKANRQQVNTFISDDVAFFPASQGCLARPNGDCVAVNFDNFKNAWYADVPRVGIDTDLRIAQGTISKVMNDGSIASIMYNPRAKYMSFLKDAGGNTRDKVHRQYCACGSNAVRVCRLAAPLESALEHGFGQIRQLSSGSQLQEEKDTESWLKLLLGGARVIVLVAIIIAWVKNKTERRREEGSLSAKLTEEFEKLSATKKFSFEELMIATNSFARDRILGEGDSGIVYKGHMGGARTVVAVKKIKSGSRQGIKEYISEVKSLSQLRHRNLVQLIGYCHKANEFILVYEFMRGGSLEDHLFKGRPLLTWERRYNISLGLASAVHYLHKQCNQCVIHRDITSCNTMLDEKFEAKLGDFGFAKLVDHAGELKATDVVGTTGYVALENHQMSEASKEFDIYNFGVVLLEIVCGRRVIEDQCHVVVWVREQYGRGKLPVDSKLGKNFSKKQAKALMIAGLWCAHPDVRCRPSIEAAMAVLNLRADLSNLPSDIRHSKWKVLSRGFRFGEMPRSDCKYRCLF
ncbi:L-type lectin-domain containing receptor kinase IX.1-like [Eucalyptus grandis]|uniref:L-type lectin-domain containing receptor kinase IX.1-like n=1 Tax=Eucalyptus grandis TaxID=71139 RepID=UPI00192EBF4C|nr:L-type lectin-domain containing receptor kinase IX.1-like [Eucalyptus grandis]